MSSRTTTPRTADSGVLRVVAALVVLVGLHFIVEGAVGMVHSLPGSSALTRVYAFAVGTLCVAVGVTVYRTGSLGDRRLEAFASVLAGLVVVLAAVTYLL